MNRSAYSFCVTVAVALAAAVCAAPGARGEQNRANAGDSQAITQPVYRHLTLAGPLTNAARAALQRNKVELLKPLGGNQLLVKLTGGDATESRLRADADVIGVRELTLADKLHPALRRADKPQYAIVKDAAGATRILALVLLHEAENAEATFEDLALRHDAQRQGQIRSLPAALLALPEGEVDKLALDPRVQWIEPPLPRFEELNAENRAATQADIVQEAPYDLDGTGVTVMIYDGGAVRDDHVDFDGRVMSYDGAPVIDHATHVAGTVGGSGAASGGLQRGMAPGVSIASYGLPETPGSGIFLHTNPGDLEADYADALLHDVAVTNNSVGTNISINGFDCELLGNYGITSALIDDIVRGSLGRPVSIVWAAGNERGVTRCGDTYATISTPSGAKNSIGVGAIEADTLAMTEFSSWGPTDDGRIKPDIVAPGCQVSDDEGVTSTSAFGPTRYSTKCGTSMAAPTVTGICALLLQEYRTQFPGSDDCLNSTLKALLVQTALDLETPGPDYVTGYGLVQAQAAVDVLRAGGVREHTLAPGEVLAFDVLVSPEDNELRVTIAWDDPPGAPGAAQTLVNDLDLRAISPTGEVHYPWTLDPLMPDLAAVPAGPDHTNNVEQVVVFGASPGVWRVEVEAFALTTETQTFSVATNHVIAPTGLTIGLLEQPPASIAPGTSATFNVWITAIGEDLVDTPKLRFRYDGGTFLTRDLEPLGDDVYRATLPGPSCTATPEFYVSATGDASGELTVPTNAPTDALTTDVGITTVLFADDFEMDRGWTVGDPSDTATRGIWSRGIPEGTTAQPAADHSTDGEQCYATDHLAGDTTGAGDVDDGATTLTSPPISVPDNPEAVCSYWRWYSNDQGANAGEDVLLVEVTGDNGVSWQTVEVVGPTGNGTHGGWYQASFRVRDILPAAEEIRLRFIAEDALGSSLIEAAIDDVVVDEFACQTAIADCDGNGVLDADDIADGRLLDANGNGVPDSCEPDCPEDLSGDGRVDHEDLGILLADYLDAGPGDINDDGVVNHVDLGMLLARYLEACPE